MSRLKDAAYLWWAGRTLRERRLLLVMWALIAATAVWLCVVRPILDWRSAAAERVAIAEADLAAVRVAAVTLTPKASGPARPAEGLEPLVRRTAEAAGVTVVTTMSPSGRLGFQATSVQSGPLFSWLSVLESDHQLAICDLGVVENADATLNAEGAVSGGDCRG
ncbi:MAG: type II secretion system protein GspM [Brevundimonas sp.]